jgi:MerR family transcriptional regulator, light-induced transcriptional regulator
MQDEFVQRQLTHARPDQERVDRAELTRPIQPADIERMVGAALAPDDDAVAARAQSLLREGLTLRQLYQEVIAPAAQELGRLWEDDHADFVEVTVGAGRLQRLIRDLGRSRSPQTVPAQDAFTVVLSAPDDETHTLGLTMVADCFLVDGWLVEMGAPLGSASAVELVKTHDVDLVGLCLTRTDEVDGMTSWISAIRHHSRNQNLTVLVGGRAFVERPDMVSSCGADGFTPDAMSAPSVARSLVRARRRPHLYVPS